MPIVERNSANREELEVTGYAFGDTGLAARRLARLASIFEESSAAFMRRSVDFRPRLAVDLGCGPGYSTSLVANTLKPDRTVGLDNSESFLSHARATASEGVSFHLHDITTTPFPTGLCDVMFGRFELTHLRDPEAVVQLWLGQLRTGPRSPVDRGGRIHRHGRMRRSTHTWTCSRPC